MLRYLESAINLVESRLVLLAPHAEVPVSLSNVEMDVRRHRQFLREMQKLRGSVYLHDGAVSREALTPEGLHETVEDEKSWHLLMVNGGHVTGCAWYLEHENTVPVDHLRVRHCPLAKLTHWREKLWRAVESELAMARRNDLRYAEVGGWAVAEDSRCTSEGLVLALAGYSLGRIRGGCLGMTTATVRHCSSSILRRIGGASLEADGTALPSYYDPRYKCEMEILRFDSRKLSAKYAGLVEMLCHKLANIRVIARPSVPILDTVALSSWSVLDAGRRTRRAAQAALAS